MWSQLYPRAVRLLSELKKMGFCIGEDPWRTLPYVIVVLVMLIEIFILCLNVPISALEMRKIQDSALARLDNTVIVVVVRGWVDGLVSLWRLLWLFWEVNILRNRTFCVSYRSHDVGIPKVTSFSYFLLSTSHPRHVDHAWISTWRSHNSLLLFEIYLLAWLRLLLSDVLLLLTIRS